MLSVDQEWESFLEDGGIGEKEDESKGVEYIAKETEPPPKCTDIYISTQTKIAYLNSSINLNNVFWKVDVMPYQVEREGVLKKQMKVNSTTKAEVVIVERLIKESKGITIVDMISSVDNPNARKTKFKDVRKINVGISKKDLISYRIKRRGAFYNCFVLILRIAHEGGFKEAHVKVFNTGKLEIPGIQTTEFLYKVLDKLIDVIKDHCDTDISYNKPDIQTVLINSNFSCNYFIDRDKLADIIKYDYNMHVVFDPCSYPGIQCKFYYNRDNVDNTGVCSCTNKCSKKGTGTGDSQCLEVSFMIFRTGSVLIVGNCDETILRYIYAFIKRMLHKEYHKISIPGVKKIKPGNKKVWKKTVLFTVPDIISQGNKSSL